MNGSIRQGFFQVSGGSLDNEARSYIKRKADIEFYNNLKASNFSCVLNSRQMGKSSLRVRTRYKLQQDNILCPSVDLKGFGTCDDPLQWYATFANRIAKSVGLQKKINWKEWWKDQSAPPVYQFRLFIEELLLEHYHQPIVIFVDEIDAIRGQNFSLDGFFDLIRFFYDHRSDESRYRRLTFALLGVASPHDLIDDKSKVQFNIGNSGLDLTGFSFEEAQPFIEGLRAWVRKPQDILREVLHWTGGQPFLTQKLCQLVVDSSAENGTSDVNRIVQEHIISDWISRDEPEHLRTIRDRILGNEKQYSTRLLELYRQILQDEEIKADNSPEQEELRLSGLVIKKNNSLRTFNRIYESVFNEDWVEEQLDAIRPYSSAIQGWINSQKQDVSYLLTGNSRKQAQDWSSGKNLSTQDYQYLDESLKHDTQRIIRRTTFLSATIFISAVSAGSYLSYQSIKAANAAKIETRNAKQELQQVQTKLTEATQNLVSRQEELDKTQEELGKANKNLTEKESQLIGLQDEKGKIANELEQANNDLFDTNQQLSGAIEAKNIAVNEKEDAIVAKNQASEQATVARELRDTALQGLKIAEIGTELEKQGADALARFEVDQVDGLITALNASIRLQNVAAKNNLSLVDYPAVGPIFALRKILDSRWQGTVSRFWEVETFNVESLTNVSISPNGEHVLNGSENGVAQLRDKTGKILRTFDGHTGIVRASFNPQGTHVLTYSEDGIARIWDLEINSAVTLEGHSSAINYAEYSRDGNYILTASDDQTIRIWDASGEHLNTLSDPQQEVVHATFSPDSQYVVGTIGSKGGIVALWSIEAQKASILIRTGTSQLGTFSEDGKYILTTNHDARAIELLKWQPLMELAKEQEALTLLVYFQSLEAEAGSITAPKVLIHKEEELSWLSDTTDFGLALNLSPKDSNCTINPTGSCFSKARVSPDGQSLLYPDGDKAFLIDLAGNELATFKGHDNDVQRAIFSSDGNQILTYSSDATARLWDTEGNNIAILRGHKNVIYSGKYSDDDRTIITTSENEIKLWNLAEHQNSEDYVTVSCPHDGGFQCFEQAKFSPDGTHILVHVPYQRYPELNAVGSLSHSTAVEIWDYKGQRKKRLRTSSATTIMSEFDSTGQQVIISDSEGGSEIFNLLSEQSIKIEHRGQDGFTTARFSPNGEHIVVFFQKQWQTQEKTPYLLDNKGNKIKELAPSSWDFADIKFSPDSQLIALSKGSLVVLFDISGNQIGQIEASSGHIEKINFSPDGNYLITAARDNTAKLWNLENLSEVNSLDGHLSYVMDAKFSPDGKYILTRANGGTVRLWDKSGSFIALLGGTSNCVNDSTKRNCLSNAEFGADSQVIITHSDDNLVGLWDLRGRLLAEFTEKDAKIYDTQLSPDGKRILLNSDKRIQIIPFQGIEELILQGCLWLLNNQEVLDAGSALYQNDNAWIRAYLGPDSQSVVDSRFKNDDIQTCKALNNLQSTKINTSDSINLNIQQIKPDTINGIAYSFNSSVERNYMIKPRTYQVFPRFSIKSTIDSA